MSIIASAKVLTLPEPWKGEVTSGSHQFLTDKPESLEGMILVQHLMIF